MTTKDTQKWISAKEAIALLGISHSLLYVLIKKGEIPTQYIAGHPCFLVGDIIALDRKRRGENK